MRALRPHRSQQSGFTLLEVVVATTLMAVLMGILFSGLRLGANAWRRGNERLEAEARKLASVEVLNLQLAAAVPALLAGEGKSGRISYLSFRGSPQQLRFLTRTSWARDRSRGLWLVAYQVVATPAGQRQLVVSEAGISDGQQLLTAFLAEDVPSARSERLGEPAERIEFSYLQPSSTQGPSAWVPEWRAEERRELPPGFQVRWWRGGRADTCTFVIPATREAK